AWIAAATGEEHTNSFLEAQTWSAGFFVGHAITAEMGSGWRRGWLQYGFEVTPFFAQTRPDHVYGGGFAPVIFRWDSALKLKHARPYCELGGGALRTTANPPSGDTSNFNFTVRGGGGIYIPASGRKSLDLGLRWTHISNANLGTRNPEFNGIEIRLGYHWLR